MYLRNIKIKNYGSIGNLDYTLPFSDDGNPLPVVLIGKNGTGKTLLLSNILNSLIDIKRTFYNDLQDVSDNNYYRLLSKEYIKTNESFSYIRTEFDDNSYNVDLMTKNYDEFSESFNIENFPDINITDEELKKDGFFHNLKTPQKDLFENSIYLYFPVDRFYFPTWENLENKKISFVVTKNNIIGKDKFGIVQYDLLKKIEEISSIKNRQ